MTAEIQVIITLLPNGNVDSRAYYNGEPLIGKNGSGKDCHLGQISSSISWAMHDMREHFRQEWDTLFPEGWELTFKLQEATNDR